MEVTELDILGFRGGFYDTDRLVYPPDALAAGSQNFFHTSADKLRAFKGLGADGTGGREMFAVAGGYASLNDYNNGGTVTANGSVFNFINESLWWVGAGEVFYNGTTLGNDFRASSSLSLSPKDGSTYTNAFTAGLAQPSAPTVASKDAGVGFTGILDGTYSFKIARVRSLTGARSIASTTSSVILTNEQTARLTFPALDANGQDRWAIFATKAGFGGVGLHYLVEEIDDTDLSTIDGVARSYELEFNDSDLLPILAYIDDYPPPACLFAARLENYVLAIGAYQNTIAASIRNFPESYHPEHLGYLPETPTAVLPDQLGAYLYVATKRSVHAVSVTFAENPLAIQTVWADTGIEYQHNWCQAGGTLFAFVSEQGAVAMDISGNPSTEFAEPVANLMKSWTPAATRVFPCPHLNGVLFCNNETALLFNYQNRKWSSPAYTSQWDGQIESGVVVDRQLKITLNDPGAFNLYDFDVSDGTSITAKAVSADKSANFGNRVNIDGIKACFTNANANNTVIKLYCDYSATATKTLTYAASTGVNTTQRTRWFVPRKETYRIEITQTITTPANDAYPSFVVIYGGIEESNRL